MELRLGVASPRSSWLRKGWDSPEPAASEAIEMPRRLRQARITRPTSTASGVGSGRDTSRTYRMADRRPRGLRNVSHRRNTAFISVVNY
ncbi:hypothetical protein GCM10010336_24220 [Streptomyces goshikiensis]|nr:hypothetical protein GCM10010336_24220 [Streptomyces goshikiensis]